MPGARMKAVLISCLLAALSCVSFGQTSAQRPQPFDWSGDRSDRVVYDEGNQHPPKPAISLALSILVPGAGQVYNGQLGKGLLFAGVFWGGVVLLNRADITKSHQSVTAFGWMSVILTGGTYITNLIDAATTAEGLADRSRRPAGGLGIGSHELNFGIAVAPRAAGVNVAFTL